MAEEEMKPTIAYVYLCNLKVLDVVELKIKPEGVYVGIYEEGDYNDSDYIARYFYPMRKVKRIEYKSR